MFQDEQSQKYVINEFVGFDQSKHSQFLLPGQTQNAQNMNFDDGNLSVCSGFSKYITASLPSGVKTLMTFYKNNGDGTQTSYVLASTDTTLYYFNGASWVTLKSGLKSGFFDYINYQKGVTDLIIMTNGKDNVIKWDGTTLADLGGSPPKFKSITLHFERVWGTAEDVNLNEVAYSASLNPEDWTQTANTGGIIDLPTWDGGKCIAIMSLFDNVVIFKTKHIFRVYGTYPGEYQNKSVFSSTGAIAERSIVNAVTVAFFLAEDGIYAYNNSTAQLISNQIKDVIDSMNVNYADKAVGVYWKNKYILAIPTGISTINDTVIEFDTIKQAFNIKKGIHVTSFAEYNNKLLFVNEDIVSGNSYVYEYESGDTFNGTPIEAFYETPDTDWNIPNATKISTYVYATLQGQGQIQIDSIFDGIIKSTIIDLPSTTKTIKARIRNKGRRFKFRFKNINGSHFTLINPQILMDVDED